MKTSKCWVFCEKIDESVTNSNYSDGNEIFIGNFRVDVEHFWSDQNRSEVSSATTHACSDLKYAHENKKWKRPKCRSGRRILSFRRNIRIDKVSHWLWVRIIEVKMTSSNEKHRVWQVTGNLMLYLFMMAEECYKKTRGLICWFTSIVWNYWINSQQTAISSNLRTSFVYVIHGTLFFPTNPDNFTSLCTVNLSLLK